MPPLTHTLRGTTSLPLVDDLVGFGDGTALVADEGEISYREIARRVSEAAAELGTERRLVRITARNDVATVVAYLAALSARCPVLLLPDTGESAEAVAAAYDPDVTAVALGDSVRWLEHRPASRHELHDELALLMTTSGTTGSPKLVRLSYANLQANAEAIAAYLDIRGTDRAATTLPLSYCYGLSVLNSHLLRGAGLILTELSVADPEFWALFRRERGTSFAGVPYTFELLERVRFPRMRLPHLRYVTQAGGRLSPEVVARYAALGRRRGWDLFVMYGQTEATARMAYLPPALAESHPAAIGVAVPGGSFRLEPTTGDPDECAGDDVGELVYSGPNVMLGYAESPGDLSTGRTVGDLRTGDLARRTADGLYEIVGRRSRFAKVYGVRVDLDRVEAMFAARGLSARCAAVDDVIVVATVDARGADAAVRAVRAQLGVPSHAVSLRVLPEMPMLPSGKPDYRRIAAADAPPDLPHLAAAGTTDVDGLVTIFAEALDRPDATPEDTFVSLGGDSLSYVEVSVRLEDALGEVPGDWHHTPIRDLAPAPARTLRRRAACAVDTSIALRAVAIVLVVGSHGNLFTVLGGAHLLVAVAGFNFARFHLLVEDTASRARRVAASVRRIAVPTVAWVAVASLLLTDDYSVANLFLANAVAGPRELGPAWCFWFIEALVYLLLAAVAVLSVPAVHRLERRAPFVVAMAVVAVGVLLRESLLGRGLGPDLEMPYSVVWLFGLGWAAAVAARTWQRLVVSAAAVAAIPGYFYDLPREAVVVGGLLLLVWAPTIPTTPVLRRVLGVLAASSLYVYVTHWQVYPHLQEDAPLLALLASLAVGIGYWQVCARAPGLLASATTTGSRGRA